MPLARPAARGGRLDSVERLDVGALEVVAVFQRLSLGEEDALHEEEEPHAPDRTHRQEEQEQTPPLPLLPAPGRRRPLDVHGDAEFGTLHSIRKAILGYL